MLFVRREGTSELASQRLRILGILSARSGTGPSGHYQLDSSIIKGPYAVCQIPDVRHVLELGLDKDLVGMGAGGGA